ncbi:MAG: hypothetical protein ACI392_07940 [Paludibacteraceae bacterium]
MKKFHIKSSIPFIISYIGIILGVLLHIFEVQAGFWIFAVSAVIFVIIRMLTLPKTDDKRTRRLYAQLMIGAGCLLGTVYLMYVGQNAWAITLIISAFIDIWVSFRLK